MYIAESLQECGLESAQSFCGKDVTVAVLDTGVDVSVFNGTSAPTQFDTDVPRRVDAEFTPNDPCGHGTIVTTVIRRGAPGATIFPVKVMGCSGNLMSAISGLLIAIPAARPQIFNLSLGLTCDPELCRFCRQPVTDSPVTLQQLTLLFQQVDKTYEYNGFPKPLLVAAAGNVEKDSPLTVPASLQDVLAVGAYDSRVHPERPSGYSQYDKEMLPVERFVRAPGGIDTRQSCFGVLDADSATRWGSELLYGTSFSTALASAVAARYLCATRGSPCGRNVKRWDIDRTFLYECLKRGANKEFKGFDSSIHGLGIVRYELDVVSRLLE
jgi:subtilisin family serine protease